MDNPPDQLPWLEISIFLLSIVVIFATLKITVLDDDEERSVHFQVPVPEQCSPDWKGEILDEPTVKVPSPFAVAVRELTRVTDPGIERHQMLLPSQWSIARTREPFHGRWNRQSDSQGQGGSNRMGEYNVQATTEGAEDDAEVC